MMAVADRADIDLIKRLIPHRYPFLLIDRVEKVTETGARGIKNVTANEPHFEGHFPAEPVMPGVLIVEALAQTSCVFVGLRQELEGKGALVYFMGIDQAKFRRKVVPGDVLELAVEVKRGGGRVWKFEGRATVGEDVACEATFTAMLEMPKA